jgi:hypothetical protein
VFAALPAFLVRVAAGQARGTRRPQRRLHAPRGGVCFSGCSGSSAAAPPPPWCTNDSHRRQSGSRGRTRDARAGRAIVFDAPALLRGRQVSWWPPCARINYDERWRPSSRRRASFRRELLRDGNPNTWLRRSQRRGPQNVTLTGFLSDAAYGSLVSTADAVLTLTERVITRCCVGPTRPSTRARR